MHFSLDKFLQSLNLLEGKRTLTIGFSGGLDSHVLLHWLSQESFIREHFYLRAVYINHQLSPKAKQWEAFCRDKANTYAVDFHCVTVEVLKEKGDSLEAKAREARYEALNNLIEKNDYLLTAHHKDDQLETFLLQLFRGAGLEGLSAMPVLSSFGKGFHYRPFLSYTRENLETYAKENNLTWIEDESNFQLSFNRNYLRHEIIPLIKNRWPAVPTTVSRSASHCAQAKTLLETLQKKSLDKLVCDKTKILDISLLLVYSSTEQIYLIREWLKNLDFTLPSAKKMQEIQRTLLNSREDAMPCVAWEGVEIRRFAGRLYAMSPLNSHTAETVFSWDLSTDLLIPSLQKKLIATREKGKGLKIHNTKNITVRFRQGGERIRLLGKQHSQTLKNLFQEWEIPTWERDRIPLIFEGDKLLAIVGYGYDNEHLVSSEEMGWVFSTT